jgi:hypothetical protein
MAYPGCGDALAGVSLILFRLRMIRINARHRSIAAPPALKAR